MRSRCFFAIFFFGLALPLSAQVTPEASKSGLPFAVGGGFSDYDVDWGHGRMEGGTIWIDWHPTQTPSFLHGFGLEAEARDISLGGNRSKPSNFRLDTVGGGVIYTWQRFHNVHPYAKFLLSLGGIDWNNPVIQFRHETRTVYAPGFGFDTRVLRHVWARIDYEYQAWPQIDLAAPGTHWLDPQGFTVGVEYDFRTTRSR
jgi:opacity protein-like surface antigen